MDYGFVHGKKYNESEINNDQTDAEQGNKMQLKPCRNCCNCYPLMTDACTRYSWFFSFADKKPPVSVVNVFLKKHGKPQGTVRTEKGGEIANFIDFRKMIRDYLCSLETTAP